MKTESGPLKYRLGRRIINVYEYILQGWYEWAIEIPDESGMFQYRITMSAEWRDEVTVDID